jgi:hypothetical protein
MGHVNNKFERKTKTGRRFHGRGIFFRQSRRRGKFLGRRVALQNACRKENVIYEIDIFSCTLPYKQLGGHFLFTNECFGRRAIR